MLMSALIAPMIQVIFLNKLLTRKNVYNPKEEL